MSYNIIWSEPAKQNYQENIEYLLDYWHEKQVQSFIQEVESHLTTISNNPKSFALTKYRNVRSVPVIKQITLFYRLNGNSIELIRFWNNYQNPDKLLI